MALDTGANGARGSAQAVLLRHQHSNDLVSAGDQRVEVLNLGVAQGADGWTDGLSEVGKDLGVKSVGLGQLPGGPGKVPPPGGG